MLVVGALGAGLLVVRPLDAVLVTGHALLLVRAALTWPEWSARVSGFRFRPALLVTGSFAALILVGTALLLLPVSVAGPGACRPVDALFTATSAACVTGLIVVDTGTFWSPFGHAVILLLIEAGGLGIMTLWAGMLILAGRHLGMRESVALGGILESDAPRVLRRTIRRIVLWTVAVEMAGTLLLLPAFLAERGASRAGSATPRSTPSPPSVTRALRSTATASRASVPTSFPWASS